ncbi:NifB/NifX family molybdenum-iron cluster-binding protein [bacterium]|nr:NifB/NifX family molybdenum-iron cluster-binding protein [bacterium]
MKIIITSQSEDLKGKVDPRFGRAKHFILYDTMTDDWEAIDNSQNLNAIQGAGIQAAENVARTGAEYLLTGHCGPKAFRSLTANGIKVVTGMEGTVEDAVDKFKKGELKPNEECDVDSHWA